MELCQDRTEGDSAKATAWAKVPVRALASGLAQALVLVWGWGPVSGWLVGS